MLTVREQITNQVISTFLALFSSEIKAGLVTNSVACVSSDKFSVIQVLPKDEQSTTTINMYKHAPHMKEGDAEWLASKVSVTTDNSAMMKLMLENMTFDRLYAALGAR